MRQVAFNKRKAKWKEELTGWLFILPVVIGLVVFTFLPVVYAFISSFFQTGLKEFSLTNWGEFVGFGNYISNFTVYAYASTFWQSMKVTVVFAVVNIPLQLVLSFCLAVLLNKEIKGIRFIRALCYLPCLIPAVCGGMLWSQITDANYGVLNSMLTSIGITGWKWFDSASSSMPSLIFIQLFQLGGSMVLWLSQLKNIPKSMYESANIEGASKLRQLIFITVPMCAPMILYNLIMGIIGALQTYEIVATLVNNGGANNSLLFYVMNIYSQYVGKFGYACALSFILLFITAMLSMLVMKMSKNVYYSEEG